MNVFAPWRANPKVGVRLTEMGYPDYSYKDYLTEDGTLMKRSMIMTVYPDAPSFSKSSWKVFDTEEAAQAWVNNPKPTELPKPECSNEAKWRGAYVKFKDEITDPNVSIPDFILWARDNYTITKK